MPLNQDQLKAAEEIFEFILGDTKEYLLSGGAGTGKSFLLNHVIHEIFPEYKRICKLSNLLHLEEIIVTATTHPACQILRDALKVSEVATLHSMLGISIADDYSTGKVTMNTYNAVKVRTPSLVIVDEAFVMDYQLRQALLALTPQCKILYVGDKNQMLNVTGRRSGLEHLPTSHLSIVERSSDQHLIDLYQQLARNVTTHAFEPIKLAEGVIDWFDPDQMLDYVLNTNNTYSIGTYTNTKSDAIHQLIRESKGITGMPVQGEKFVLNKSANSTARYLKGGSTIVIDRFINIEELVIKDARDEVTTIHFYSFNVKTLSEGYSCKVTLPMDKTYVLALQKYYATFKDWKSYFRLKNFYLDVRAENISTVYKLQGNSVHTVALDLSDISTCTRQNEVARMQYVGVSRATHRVIFFGELSPKYGSIAQ